MASSSIHFANTILKTDSGTFRAGDVISNAVGGNDPWSQCIILGFSDTDKYGDVYVRLARPFAYASCVGTTCASVLQGVETFDMSASKLVFETVLTRNGNHPMVAGGKRPDYDSEVIDIRTSKAVRPTTNPVHPDCHFKMGDHSEGDTKASLPGTEIKMDANGTCVVCGESIPMGTHARWDADNNTLHHLACK